VYDDHAGVGRTGFRPFAGKFRLTIILDLVAAHARNNRGTLPGRPTILRKHCVSAPLPRGPFSIRRWVGRSTQWYAAVLHTRTPRRTKTVRGVPKPSDLIVRFDVLRKSIPAVSRKMFQRRLEVRRRRLIDVRIR